MAKEGRLEGKAAVVTGGARGIGEAIARAMHAEGARVAIADITGQEKALASELGDGAIAISADVSDDAAVGTMIAAAVDEFGALDVLCNNAGIDGDMAPIAECTVENFDRTIAVNTRGVFSGTRHAIPVMLEGAGGSIVNTASVAGLVSLPGLPAYCTSKAAVIGLTRSTAVEYGEAGIRCNAICPGVIDTPLLRSLEENDPETFGQLLEGAKAMTAVSRLGEPAEIGAMAVFLASDESSFLTGAALPVDGGYTAV